MYFNKFPSMLYNFDVNGKETAIIMSDITRNVRFRKDVLSNVTVYDEYDIVEGETPEHVAEKVYKNPNYHWIIMLTNEIYDYKKDWCLSSNMLETYIDDKYGSSKYTTKYYINSDGFIVDSTYAGTKYPVSYYDYEISINESKRRIKIIPKIYIDKILADFKGLM